jgi:glucose/arabinose dehydrogenase
MLVTERPGRLRVVRDGKLLPESVAGVPHVRVRGQGGLLEVLPHPDFATNHLLYLSFAKPNDDGSLATTAVVRGRLEDHRLVDVEEIFEAKAWARGNAHFAGRMVFDRDGYLYLSVGDRGEAPNLMAGHPAQSLTQHHGTVIRIRDDGRVPADNPFLDERGAMPEIWSYGHRNPQGMAVHPQTGEVWENEHGPRGGDEVNLVQKGANYGWPVVSFGVNYDGSVYSVDTHRQGMESPVWNWVPSIATSGMLFYTGEEFPWWRGSMFVGGLRGEQLTRLTLKDQRVVSAETLLAGVLGRIRDVRQGPDDFVYLAIDNSRGQALTRVVRLEPVAGDVAPPR